ncbi:hypothetical protein BGX31_004869, partial [Mortierella sp. GBA43]
MPEAMMSHPAYGAAISLSRGRIAQGTQAIVNGTMTVTPYVMNNNRGVSGKIAVRTITVLDQSNDDVRLLEDDLLNVPVKTYGSLADTGESSASATGSPM